MCRNHDYKGSLEKVKNHDYKASLEEAKAHPLVGKIQGKIYGWVDEAKDGAYSATDAVGTGVASGAT